MLHEHLTYLRRSDELHARCCPAPQNATWPAMLVGVTAGWASITGSSTASIAKMLVLQTQVLAGADGQNARGRLECALASQPVAGWRAGIRYSLWIVGRCKMLGRRIDGLLMIHHCKKRSCRPSYRGKTNGRRARWFGCQPCRWGWVGHGRWPQPTQQRNSECRQLDAAHNKAPMAPTS